MMGFWAGDHAPVWKLNADERRELRERATGMRYTTHHSGYLIRQGFEARLVTPNKLYLVGHGKVRSIVWGEGATVAAIDEQIERASDEIISELIDAHDRAQ